MSKKSEAEEKFLNQIRAKQLQEPKREFQFFKQRQWRFDFAWPNLMLAVEVHGGGWVGGRHHRPKGMNEDCEKNATAQLQGWTVLTITSDLVYSGDGIKWLVKFFDQMYAR